MAYTRRDFLKHLPLIPAATGLTASGCGEPETIEKTIYDGVIDGKRVVYSQIEASTLFSGSSVEGVLRIYQSNDPNSGLEKEIRTLDPTRGAFFRHDVMKLTGSIVDEAEVYHGNKKERFEVSSHDILGGVDFTYTDTNGNTFSNRDKEIMARSKVSASFQRFIELGQEYNTLIQKIDEQNRQSFGLQPNK